MFNREPKINLDYIGFVLLRSVIGPENSHHPLNQSDVKLKPVAIWSPALYLRFEQFACFLLLVLIG